MGVTHVTARISNLAQDADLVCRVGGSGYNC